MAVAFDTSATGVANSGSTSIGAFNITIGGGVTNGAVVVALCFETPGVTAISVTVGGSAATLISNTDSLATGSNRTLLYGLATGSATGNQSVVISWTTGSGCVAGVTSYSGVDQTTPFSGGVATQQVLGGAGGTLTTGSITSASGDLTVDFSEAAGGTTLTSPGANQTARFNPVQSGDFVTRASGSTGDGTGTQAHTWTSTAFKNCTSSGANIKQVSAGGGAAQKPSMLCLLGVG